MGLIVDLAANYAKQNLQGGHDKRFIGKKKSFSICYLADMLVFQRTVLILSFLDVLRDYLHLTP